MIVNSELLAIAQIVQINPVLKADIEIKKEYISRLSSYIAAGRWNRRKYVKAEIEAYKKIIFSEEDISASLDIEYYKYFILLDVIQILGCQIKIDEFERIELMKKKLFQDYGSNIDEKLCDKIIEAFTEKESNDIKKISDLLRNKRLSNEKEYIRLMLDNLRFINKKPIRITVTGTMSAGKSTFINALTGKLISNSQNVACTSKIHTVINKVFEDGYTYEYDHDLELTATKDELLNDNDMNASDNIIVGTHFVGALGAHRIVICDSPGVNYSENKAHGDITDKLISRRNYDLLIYIMNATQLGTNDDDAHLDFVKKSKGRRPVIFVINKIDNLDNDEEDYQDIVIRQGKILEKKGFKNPVICPVSSRAGFFSKRYSEGVLSRTEKRELNNYIDKFEEMGLSNYYEKQFKGLRIDDYQSEEEQLYKTSGLAYLERIIISMFKGNSC